MQKIEIKNFGPIMDLKLDIKDFMLFIGPQASGKSTIAKTIFFFRSLNDDLAKFCINGFEKGEYPMDTYAIRIRKKFLDYFGASSHLVDLHLKYYYSENIYIHITLGNHGYIIPKFSPQFEEKAMGIVSEAMAYSDMLEQEDAIFHTSKELLYIENIKQDFILSTKQKCNQLLDEEREIIFIPAGRSLLATLSDQLPFINTRNLDFLIRSFVDRINVLKSKFNKSLKEIIDDQIYLTQSKIDFETVRLAEKIIQKILKGKYQFDKDGEKIFIGDSDKYVRLNFSSSGQQESLWILLLLFIFILEQQNVFIVIEEPEAHLFPEAQKDISALIALLSNLKQSQVIITTHSPYILASVNNLILAHKVGEKHPEKVTQKINRHLWIERNKIFAAMVQSGVVSEIIDSDFDIIQQEHIDSVSQIINEEFDYLYQYETEDTNV